MDRAVPVWVLLWLVVFNASAGSSAVPTHAGCTLAIRVASRPTADAAMSARVSRFNGLSVRSSSAPGRKARARVTNTHATPRPTRHPRPPNTARFHMRAWPTSRFRDAPSAAQTASSFLRLDNRTSKRPLAFTHKTRNTRQAPPKRSGTARS